MTPEQFEKAGEIFHAALALTVEHRAQFLADVCGDDEDLRRQVESLLAAHHDAGTFIETPALEQVASEAAAARDNSRDVIGQRIAHYEISALVGEGGMGEVYKALDTRLNRPVAIKFLPHDLADESARRRFQHEAKMASALNHPHIVTVHEAGEHDGRHYLVTEFVDGGTLSEWALAAKRTWRQIVDLLVGVGDALAAAHAAGILHRDIKPSNILVSKDGYAKLADFGLAKLDDLTNARDVARSATAGTRPGTIIGTIAYMSPEQAAGAPLDARSDIFSFGVVLYELLAGRRPFAGATDRETLQSIMHATPEPLTEAIPIELRLLVEKSLEKDPAERYQTMRDLVVDLKRVRRQSSTNKTGFENEGRAGTARVGPGWRRWLASRPSAVERGLWASVAIIAVVVAVTLGTLYARYRVQIATNGRGPSQRFQLAPPPGGRFVDGGLAAGGIALSPDGKAIAFVATVDGVVSLWIQPFDGVARRIEGTAAVQRPFWSPDSKSVAYFARGGLFRVDATGGSPTLLLKKSNSRWMSGSWNEDGTILFSSGGEQAWLSTIRDSGGEEKHLSRADGGFPQWLPGGAFLYFGPLRGNDTAIYAATTTNLPGKRLVNASGLVGYFSGYLLWANGPSLFAQSFDPQTLSLRGEPRKLLEPCATDELGAPIVTVSTTGRLIYDIQGNDKQLAWYARTGQRLGAVVATGWFQGFRLFDSGRRVMIQENGKELGLRLIDDRGFSSRILANTVAVNPTPSRDGKSIVYSTGQPGGLFRSDISGENPVPLNTSDQSDFRFPMDWSGDVLLFDVVSPGRKDDDIWSVRVMPDGRLVPGVAPVPYLRTGANEGLGRFAPGQNQKWLAYASNESGRTEVYVRSFPTKGEKLTISNHGGRSPVWGPGGRELFYLSSDDKIMVVDVQFSPSTVSASVPRDVFPLPMNDTVLFASPFDTIDGQRFLVLSSVAPATRPLQVIENWQELTKH